MLKSTGLILFLCIAVILAAGCTTPAQPGNTTEKIVYMTVVVTPTPQPTVTIQNILITQISTPTAAPTP